MPGYNEKWRYVTLCKIIYLNQWPEVTSPRVPSQCLPINFNIFNGKKYCVT